MAVAIHEPGSYDVSDLDYHNDPCEEPSLSRSLARRFITQSPRHVYANHPLLGGSLEGEVTPPAKFDQGKAAHALLSKDLASIAVGEFPDWRTKAAKEFRKEAYANGQTPLTTAQHEAAMGVVDEAVEQMDGLDAFDTETTWVAEWQGQWYRAKTDLSREIGGRIIVYDYKTTKLSAHPDDVGRLLANSHYDFQNAFYERVIQLATGKEVDFEFIVQETGERPYELTVHGLTEADLSVARKQVDFCWKQWKKCMESGAWPGYDKKTHRTSLPEWHYKAWIEREERELEEAL